MGIFHQDKIILPGGCLYYCGIFEGVRNLAWFLYFSGSNPNSNAS